MGAEGCGELREQVPRLRGRPSCREKANREAMEAAYHCGQQKAYFRPAVRQRDRSHAAGRMCLGVFVGHHECSSSSLLITAT